MLGFVGLGDSKNIANIKATENFSEAQKKDAAKAAIRQWWLELQHQMEAENKKTTATENGKPFLLTATDTLQPLLDITFFRYWDIQQVRDGGERKFQGEQTSRFVNDLLRENEDAAVTALKDYLKYKLYSGVNEVKGEGEPVPVNKDVFDKKKEMVEADTKAALAKFDLQTAITMCLKCKPDDADAVEKLLEDAKTAKADVADLEEQVEKCKDAKKKKEDAKAALEKAVGEASPETVQALEKACRNAKDSFIDTSAEEKKLDETKEMKKHKLTEPDDKVTKHVEYEAEKRAKVKEEADKKQADELAKLEASQKEERTKLEEDTKKTSEDGFTEKWREACNGIVDAMADAYKKAPFTNRQAADAKFRELIEDSDKVSQNAMNKIFNLENAEQFDQLCTSLGFTTDSYGKALEKLSPPEEEEKEEKKES